MEIDYKSMQLEQLLALMKAVLSGNNQHIQQATKALKLYTKHKQSIRLLSYVLAHNPDAGIRQLSTVLLNSNLINLYNGLAPPEQLQFRNLLLHQFNADKSLNIQKGIGNLVGQLLPVIELKNWPELQQMFEHNLAKTPDSPATLVLLYSLLYHFTPPPIINSYLIKCLQQEKLIDYALKCLVAIVESQDTYDQQLSTVLIAGCESNHWQEQHIYRIIEIFTAMADKRGKIKTELVSWVCKKIISNRRLPEKLRICGVDFLFTVVDIQLRLLQKNPDLLKEVVETACLACSQPPHKQEQDEQPIQEVALWLIESMSINMKPKKIYPVLFEAVTVLINSDDVHKMNTGYLILGSMSEGCSDKVKKNLPNPIMNTMIPKGLAHTAPEVRGAAICALCFFSEFLIPDIVDYHRTIIPSMMGHINDLSNKVAEKALMALDIFIENLEPEQIFVYLPIIIPRLLEILASDKSSFDMKSASLSALGSLVVASEDQFRPYLEKVCQVSFEILKLHPSPEINSVRAENISLQGRLANQFCKLGSPIQKTYFQNFVLPHLETIYSILTKESEPHIREACFSFFYLLANAIGSEFEPIFDKIVVEVLKQCNVEVGVGKKKQTGFSLDSDSEQQEMDVKLTELDEKASAIHALGELAKACSIKFIPHFQQAFQILQDNYQFFYDNIRIQVMSCYENMALALIKSKHNNQVPKYKQGIPCTQRYPLDLQNHFHQQLVPRLIFVMTQDDSNEVKACAIEVMDNLIKEIGPSFIDHNLDNLTTAIVMLLEGRSGEIEDSDDDEQEQNEQEQDEDTEVNTYEPLCDLIPRLCKVIREGFEPCFKQILPSMMKYTFDREQVNDYIQIIGSFSQVFKYIPSAVSMAQDDLMTNIEELKLINDELLNRNIAYCLGVMFEVSPKTMQPHLEAGLVTLKQIYQITLVPATRENAIAAICRIVYTFHPPLPMELFIENTLKVMPFVGDETEQRTVYKMILFLADFNGQLLKPHLKRIVELLEVDLPSAKKLKIKEPLLTQLKEFHLKLKALI